MTTKNKTIQPITLDDILFVDNIKNTPVIVDNKAYLDDHFQYGLGFFETILVTDHGIFLEEHCQRLNKSLLTFKIPRQLNADTLAQFIRIQQLQNLGLKILVTPTLVIATTRPLNYTSNYYQVGANITLSPITKSSHSYLIQHKSTNYGDNILALRQAHYDGYNDCLFKNEFGHLTESSIGNLFIIKDERLLTPFLTDGLLPGVVRSYIIKNYDVKETHLTEDDLLTSSGAFLTNSLVGMINITMYNTHPIPVHPAQNTMIEKYKHYISQMSKASLE